MRAVFLEGLFAIILGPCVHLEVHVHGEHAVVIVVVLVAVAVGNGNESGSDSTHRYEPAGIFRSTHE